MRGIERSVLAQALVLLACNQQGAAFSVGGKPRTQSLASTRGPSSLNVFFADESPAETASAPVDLVTSDNESFLNMAGAFLVESFWLNSEHHQLGDTVAISDDARMNLMVEQCSDLQEKYGERMGKRLMNCCVVGALDLESKEMLGLVTLKEALMMNGEILEAEKAEAVAKNAVASLGPKQRRMYKDASMDTVARELLPTNSKSVCVISNLAVSTKARRRGIAKTLCAEAEALASDWGHREMHLLVESENTAARKLYEDKLGYRLAFTQRAALAMRADIEEGTFIETQADTLILCKKF
jgi:ribosomal protein S18 acetylase RimI-like enzyme